MRDGGYDVASLDIEYWDAPHKKQNFMDILQPAGMALLVGVSL